MISSPSLRPGDRVSRPTETRMFAEAAEASEVVARLLLHERGLLSELGKQWRADPPRAVLTCARGSSDHAALYLKHLMERHSGIVVASLSPSIASIYRTIPAARGMLAIGMSQSGRSPDLLAAMSAVSNAGARTLAMVNKADSPLAQLADIVLPLHAASETSVAATKSFIALLAATAALVAHCSGDESLSDALAGLPELLSDAWNSDWSLLVDELADLRGLYVIGRGPGLGIAAEAALKLKETCGLHAEAFSAAEVRHGPMALVGPELPLLLFTQDDQSAEGTRTLVADALSNGARVIVASDGPTIPGTLHLPLPTSDPRLAPILAIQAFYRAANMLSLRRGFDPDRPPHLNKVTETV